MYGRQSDLRYRDVHVVGTAVDRPSRFEVTRRASYGAVDLRPYRGMYTKMLPHICTSKQPDKPLHAYSTNRP